MPSISKRGGKVPMSPFRKLIPFADKAKAAGKHVYHLNIGQPDIETPAYALQKVRETTFKILEYSPAEGIASYRRKLADYYRKFGIEAQANEIIVTTGASEAILFAMLACLDPGDEVIVPEPFYANYNGFAQIADVHIRPITSYIDTGFALPDVEAFESVIGPRTRAILITNPSNPTGTFYSREVLEGLGSLARNYGIFLFADEVYRDFCYDGNEFFSILNIPGIEEHAILIDSISKRYSACGARVGSIVTRNQQVLGAVLRYAKLRLSPPGFGQILAEATLEMEDTYINEVRDEYRRRRDVVYGRLSRMQGVVSYRPGGAFYCFAKFPVDSAEHFCQWLLEEFEHQGATVMLSPGEGFYATPGLGVDEVRLAYVLNCHDLDAAMDCLEVALKEYPYKKQATQAATTGPAARRPAPGPAF
ncbi:MAG: pyridoxal phosphate-dependent aminotransferase [Phaeodactylibacter sp.]|nr:pyridoxal phosphate-dependent aminotransferase [Phaeodactylibacter sp.]MCB9274348.1 pyridoxal phosphate-dependent aminotransferase [Lewinellaceae bacterium]